MASMLILQHTYIFPASVAFKLPYYLLKILFFQISTCPIFRILQISSQISLSIKSTLTTLDKISPTSHHLNFLLLLIGLIFSSEHSPLLHAMHIYLHIFLRRILPIRKLQIREKFLFTSISLTNRKLPKKWQKLK